MALDADILLDRRRLKRRLTLWRVLAVLTAVLLIAVAAGRSHRFGSGAQIARLDVSGIIISDSDRDKALADLIDNADIKALIVSIDSPGGTVVGGESLYRKLRSVAAAKPVVAVMGETAASAAYMTAIASDHIVAHSGTVTGSIGVILQHTQVVGLLEKLGITTEAIKSGPLKAVPSPFETLTPEGRDATKVIIADLFAMFVDMVAERRGMPREQALRLADGRIYSGRQALGVNLIDEIGGEDEAVSWLVKTRGIKEGLPVRDLKIEREEDGWRELLTGMVGKAMLSERLRLDGLLSLWQP